MAAIVVTNSKPSSLPEPSITRRQIKSGLLKIAAVFAVFSIIPPLRFACGLASRSIAVLATTVDCVKQDEKTWHARLTNFAKLSAVALGLAGLAACSPAVILASLVADLGVQIFEMGKALYHGKKMKALIHFQFVVINTLLIGAIAASSWPLVIAAATTSAAALFILGAIMFYKAKETEFTHREKSDSQVKETLCYLALSLVGIGSIFQNPATGSEKVNSLDSLPTSEFPALQLGGTVHRLPVEEGTWH